MTTSRLASLLVQDGLVAPKQMADAFQRQVIYGGTLDTILLEMNAINEPQLISALGRSSALPTAESLPNVERLQASGTLGWFPLALAEKFRAIPLSVEGQVVRVLTTDPADRRALDELGLQIGRAVEAVISPEHRFITALSLVYDTVVPARFQSLQARLARRAAQAGGEAAPVAARAPVAAPAPVAAAASPRSVITDFPVAGAPVHPLDEQQTPRLTTRELDAPMPVHREIAGRELASAKLASPAPSAPASPPLPSPDPLGAGAAIEAIDAATDRDEIFVALCRGARSRGDYVALFTVHADTMVGRIGLADTWIEHDRLATLSLPLDAPSPFRTVSVGQAAFVGRVGEEVASRELLEAIGRRPPLLAMILPIILRERTVALLYIDASGKALPQATMAELSTETAAAVRAFQRLILSAKSKDYRAASTATAAKIGAGALPAVTVEAAGGWRNAGGDDAGRLAAPSPPSEGRLADTARHLVSPAPSRDTSTLFASVERGDEHARISSDQLVELGARGAELTVARLPGPLRIDRTSYRGPTPPLAEHGPLLALTARFGELAVPFLMQRLGEANPELRFYTTLALGELGRESQLHLVGARLFDHDASVRKVAVDVLTRLPPSEPRTSIIEQLRGELPGPEVDRQRMATDALGALGDPPSVPRLIELVKHDDNALQAAARRALIAITKQDFGTSRWRWRSWWDRHKSEPRVEWMFEGLAHSEELVRGSAHDELRQLFPDQFGYQRDAPKRDREEARKKWLEWYRARRG